eukprot:gene31557-6745_t
MCQSSAIPTLEPSQWPLILCSCIILAAERSGQSTPPYQQVEIVSGFDVHSMMAMSSNVMTWLHQDLSCISVLRVTQLYVERLGHYLQEFKQLDKITAEIQSFLLKVSCSPITAGVRPSAVAAAVLVVLRRQKGQVPYWPVALELMTGYTNIHDGDLAACIAHLQDLLDHGL